MDYANRHYQIGDGICLVSNFPTYQEQFYFAFKTGKEINLNLLINQLHLLQNHVLFFQGASSFSDQRLRKR